MKSTVYASSLGKRMVLALGLVILPLYVVNQVQAKAPGSVPGKSNRTVVSMADLSGMNIKNAAQVKARLLYLVAHNPKALRVLSRGCGCAAVAPDAAMGFGSCMKGCLRDAGVSYYSMIMCGAACGSGAVPICAICLGVSLTVVEWCALGCAAFPDGYGHLGGFLGRIRHPRPRSGSSQAKLRLQPAQGKS